MKLNADSFGKKIFKINKYVTKLTKKKRKKNKLLML